MFASKSSSDEALKALIGEPDYQYRSPTTDGSALVLIPKGHTTVMVKLINPMSFGPSHLNRFMAPPIPGLETFEEVPSLSFLLEHPSGRKLVWDLGIRDDYQNYSPKVASYIPSTGYKFQSHGSVADILRNSGVKLDTVEAVIWSHWHWDHIGDPSTFPKTTALIVGPGFKKSFLPAAPQDPDSPLQESDWKGRTLREIDFTGNDAFKIGQFQALDYFGDGSFYLLNSPGHAIGHMCGLVRTTTNPATFVLLGGDVCHYSGILRPSLHVPLPDSLAPYLRGPQSSVPQCPGEAFHRLQTDRDRKDNDTLYDMTFGYDIPLAKDTVKKLQELDGDGDVFVIIAHDAHVARIVDHYPGALNDWKVRGWGKEGRWAFLEDLRAYWNHQNTENK